MSLANCLIWPWLRSATDLVWRSGAPATMQASFPSVVSIRRSRATFRAGRWFPGVLLLDHVLAASPADGGAAIEIETAKFLVPVLPGQQVDVVWRRTRADGFGFTCKVGDRTVVHGQIRFAQDPK